MKRKSYLLRADNGVPPGSNGPIRLNDGHNYWISPRFNMRDLDDLMVEVGLTVTERDPEARLDVRGYFYSKDKGTRTKVRMNGAPSVPDVLKTMKKLGYSVSDGYWNGSSGRIMDKVNSRRTLA